MADSFSFRSEGHRLSGLIEHGSPRRAAVITHPHPLYGGDMRNPVVSTIDRAYRRCGYTTLRFDFRGVGSSEGSYAEGVGETRDVQAALNRLARMGIDHIELAGYSFGTWVNARAATRGTPPARMLMVSPPVALMDFKGIGALDSLGLVVTGTADEIAPAEAIEKYISVWRPGVRLERIRGADHFYSGHLETLESVLYDDVGK